MVQIYRYDLSKLVRRLTPPRWRNAFNLNWYETLLSQIDYSQDQFNDYKDQALIELSYNGQTIYLEKMLNDRFDPVLRRIIIRHEDEIGYYLYLEGEGQPEKYLYNESETGATPTYLYNEGENVATFPEGIDFLVKAPSELAGLEAQMKSEIDKFKLAGKIYDIEYT